MGLQFDLNKENNILYTDFYDAYWSIEDISIESYGGAVMVRFTFYAYPSRESKTKTINLESVTQLDFGGAMSTVSNGRLYQWDGAFTASDVFPDGIPVTTEGQLEILYPYIKEYLGLSDAVDVLEDE
jgi:hypothetical protein